MRGDAHGWPSTRELETDASLLLLKDVSGMFELFLLLLSPGAAVFPSDRETPDPPSSSRVSNVVVLAAGESMVASSLNPSVTRRGTGVQRWEHRLSTEKSNACDGVNAPREEYSRL